MHVHTRVNNLDLSTNFMHIKAVKQKLETGNFSYMKICLEQRLFCFVGLAPQQGEFDFGMPCF